MLTPGVGCIVVLHRRFLYTDSPSHSGGKEEEEEEEDPYAYSRTACVDASLRTLELQHVLDEATRPGGQLHALRWRVTSSMNHQFLTATMVLCSLVHRGQTLNREADIVAALQRARTIVSDAPPSFGFGSYPSPLPGMSRERYFTFFANESLLVTN